MSLAATIRNHLTANPDQMNRDIAIKLNCDPARVSTERGKLKLRPCPEAKEENRLGLFKRHFCKDMNLSVNQFAEIAGCGPNYASRIRRQFHGPLSWKAISEENARFVMQGANASGVTFFEYLNSIITDARLDADELPTPVSRTPSA